MSKHTPGPWYVMDKGFQRRYPVPTVYAPGDELRYIAFCQDLPSFGEPTNNLANARLIAAAPELLEALKYAVDNPEFCSSEFDIVARAAIAKAEGQC